MQNPASKWRYSTEKYYCFTNWRRHIAIMLQNTHTGTFNSCKNTCNSFSITWKCTHRHVWYLTVSLWTMHTFWLLYVNYVCKRIGAYIYKVICTIITWKDVWIKFKLCNIENLESKSGCLVGYMGLNIHFVNVREQKFLTQFVTKFLYFRFIFCPKEEHNEIQIGLNSYIAQFLNWF